MNTSASSVQAPSARYLPGWDDAARGHASSLAEVLDRRAQLTPERLAFTFLGDGEVEADSLSYADLDRRARTIAAHLRSRYAPGERALLLYPSGLEFVAAFFGCLYAEVVAVPAYPPRRHQLQERLLGIVDDARPKVVLASRELVAHADELERQAPGLDWLATEELPDDLAEGWDLPDIDRDSLAFLQYTSGSTSAPKGVMVSHWNLVHNQRVMETACGQTEDSTFVSWLPLYHDMGLIGNVLQPVFVGARAVLMSPMSFLRRPARWLEAVSRYRATASGGPNFAYELCLSRVTPEVRESLDLAGWQVAFNGAEPVRGDTLERFAETFAECGFRREALFPCYGLAEATLFVSGGEIGSFPETVAASAAGLERDRMVPASPEESESRLLVSCGRSQLDQRVVVADPRTGSPCPDDHVGEIWLAGDSVARGYWGRPEATEETFGARLAGTGEGPFLRTGDLGFVNEAGLFVTGRIKDLIILRGRNLYPQDVERTAFRSHPALRPESTAAFAVDVEGQERLVVVQEIDRRRESEAAEAIEAIRAAVAEEHLAQVHDVVVLRAGTIPKTTSGKIQRHASQKAYAEGTLRRVGDGLATGEPAASAELPALDRRELLALDPAERPDRLVADLRRQAARLLRTAPERIDPRQPVVRLGFDSLMAVELLYSLEEGFGVTLPLAVLLEETSLEDLATRIAGSLEGEDLEDDIVPGGEEVAEYLPTHGQEGLWFQDRLAPESAAYNIAAAARVDTPFEMGALGRALKSLVARHAALRSTFHAGQAGLRVRIEDAGAELLEVDGAVSASEIGRRLREAAWRPFDLESGPILRLVVLRDGAGGEVMLLAVHHLVADFWSLAVLMRELEALYRQELGGARAELEPLPVAYSDYAAWQRRQVDGAAGERAWEYWRRELADPRPELDLPTDRPRPGVQTYRGGSRSSALAPRLADALETLSRDRGVTPFTALLAAFQALLGRFSGQDDVPVGSPTSGRIRAKVRNLPGYFVNPVVLRADLGGRPSFTELLDRVHGKVLAAFSHQDFPFALLTERLQPVRDPSRSPLFQVMFNFQKAERPAEQGLAAFALGEAGVRFSLGDLTLESLSIPDPPAAFDLTLSMARIGPELRACLQYNADLFDASTAERLLRQLHLLLDSAVSAPDRPVAALPLLSPAEVHQTLVEWSSTAAGYPRERTIHELFAAQAARAPDADAVAMGDEGLTYGELDRLSNRIARRLRRLGAGPEELVGICLERSPLMVAALLGTLKAGAGYVPLDPAYPAARIAHALKDSGARILVTSGQVADGPEAAFGGEVLQLDGRGDAVARESGEAPAPMASAGNTAYVIYTSGSTGTPKGVQISHGNAVNFLTGMARDPGMSDADTVLAVTTVAFDIAVLELYLPLIRGGRVALADAETAADGVRLARRLADCGATLMQATPATWRLLLDAGWKPRPELRMLCGGEALPRSLAEALADGGGRLWNVYGPTETTVWSTLWRVRLEKSVPVLVGRPIANTTVVACGRDLRPVPAGWPGELLIGGDGLARGYFGRPAHTAERFVPDPAGGRPGSRLYHTGDLVRTRPDGTLLHLGRLDHQVKVRGFRIELGEIESALERHPRLAGAAVIVRDAGEKTLSAFLVAAGGERPEASELRSFLGESLPAYMIPSAFTFLETLPRTPNGKTDRRALAELESPEPESGAGFVAPSNPVEEILAGLFEELLERRPIGAEGHFFSLGGHSLLAARLVSAVREALGAELAVRAVFERPTVRELAAEIAAARGGVEGESTAPPPLLAPVAREGEAALSFAQERLWWLDRLQPGNPAYNLSGAVRLRGALSVPALAGAAAEVLRRHEALRTVFRTADDGVRQFVTPARPPALPVVDLRALPAARRKGAVERLAEAEALTPFDLTRGPLLRLGLLRTEDRENVLLVSQHHMVSDGWSLTVFVRELALLYGAAAEGRPSPIPEPAVQYADYAAWQRRWLEGDVLDRQAAYWRTRLADLPTALELPTDRPRPALQTYRGAAAVRRLPASFLEAVKGLGAPRGATVYMTLLAGFQALLAGDARQSDVVVGSPIANRDRRELEDLIGFFVNTLAMRARVDAGTGFSALLEEVRETALGAFAHRHLPFERLIEELRTERDPSRHPIFQTFFQYADRPLPAPELAGLEVGGLQRPIATAKFDVELTVTRTGEDLEALVEYNTDLYDASTMARLLGHFERLLAGAAAEPGRPVAELGRLSAAERHQVGHEWNDTRVAYPPVRRLHDLIEAQAARTPEAVALVSEEGARSYREMNAEANRLAHHLLALGLRRGQRVGVHLERSPALVTSLLAIVKAGGAYVPLDPEYPEERLAYMIESSGAELVLTRSGERARVPGLAPDVRRVSLDEEAPEIAGRGAHDPGLEIDPDSLAYTLYTSGSTGRPKGVMVSHRAIVNRLLWQQEACAIGPEDRILQKTPYSFDVSVWEFFWPFMFGASLVVARPGGHKDGAYLVRTIRDAGVTTLHFVPSMLRAFLEEDHLETCTTVRRVICSGEALPAQSVERFARRLDARLENFYGPTEAAVDVTAWTCRPRTEGMSVPIGRPIANIAVHVLDPGLSPAAAGTPGELHIGGVGLARGYVGRPALTAASFVPDASSPDAGGRLYRTGDLSRRLADGRIEYLGRTDHQVKVRGFRIELGEIEAALGDLPEIAQAVVLVEEQRLIAFFVPAAGAAPETAELRERLGRTLPEFMVPAFFVELPEIPLNTSGKADRRALPSLAELQLDATADYVAPRGPEEEALADIWSRLLGVDRVGALDNFFELGGDSILAIQLASEARRAGYLVTPRDVFGLRTVRELASAARPAGPAAAESGPVSGVSEPTPVQRWFFEQELERPEHWNQAVLLSLEPGTDPARLERALAAVVDRHDALTSRFERGEEGRRQVFGQGAPARLTRWDLSRLPEPRQPPEVTRIASELQGTLDPAAGAVLRAAWFDLGPRRPGRLLLAAHHLVVDGVSWRILLSDLATAQAQLQGGGSVALAARTTSFKRWSEVLAERAAGEAVAAELDFWLAEGERPAAPLPRRGGDTAGNRQADARTVSVELDAETTRRLLAPRHGAKVDDVLLAALFEVLWSFTGSGAARVDLESHGRDAEVDADVDLSETVGWFTTLHPLVVERPAKPGEALEAVREARRRVPGGGLGYGLLRYSSPDGSVRRRLAAQPRAEVLFNYLGQLDRGFGDEAPFALAGEDAGATRHPAGRRPHLFEVEGRVTGGRMRVDWTFSEDLHDRATVERLAADLAAALEGLAARSSGGPEVDDAYALSPLQQGILFQTALDPGASSYVVQLVVDLEGELDTGAFETAWKETLRRRPELRTGFPRDDSGEPVQVVARRVELPWRSEDWRELAAAEREERFASAVAADRETGFDPAAPPLLRGLLARLDDDRHRFVWSFHHLLLDGWSVPLVLEDVMTLYGGLTAGEPLPAVDRRPFRDYVAWLGELDPAAAEDYWRERLASFRAPTRLGIDRGAEAAGGGTYGHTHLRLGAEATSALSEAARGRGLTLNTLLQGAWAVLLARYSGSDDVVFGATSSGRPAELAGVEAMIGMFINTLPVRVAVSEAEPLARWLGSLQDAEAEARLHEWSPLVQVQAWSEVPRELPLFESLLVFENYPLHRAVGQRVAGVEIRDARSIEETHYPLTVVAVPGDALEIEIGYSRERFRRVDVARLAVHLRTLLQGIAGALADADARIADVSHLSSAERHQVLAEWSDDAPHPETASLQGLFEARAAERPAAVAVELGDEGLTYGELNRRANALAHRLRDAGIRPGTPVALFFEPSLAMAVGLLGVLKSGGAWVPLDPKHPRDRLAAQLAEAQAPWILTEERFLEALPESDARPLAIDSDPALAGASPDDPEVLVTDGDLAYMIFTSGTTGRPKAVMVEHGQLRQFMLTCRDELGWTAADRSPALASYVFDVFLMEFLTPLLAGGTAQLIPLAPGLDFELLLKVLERTTVFVGVPSLLRQLLDVVERSAAGPYPRVRRIGVGGDKVPPELLAELPRVFPEAQLMVGYGPTEATIICSHYEVPRGAREVRSLIGRPFRNMRLEIRDNEGLPVPIGVPGEIWAGGTGVARGYLGRDELTAEKFVRRDGRRYYRTGDLARFTGSGQIEFLHRVDQQVKVRGFRVETGEVEAALARDGEVRQAVVDVHEDERGEKHLVAWIVPAPDARRDGRDLRRSLGRSLPAYMVPEAFLFLDEIPLGPGGKVDRKALPAPELSTGATRVAARNPTEELLAGIWGQVLELAEVGVDDNFFELGGHSLVATRVMSRVGRSFDVDLPLRTLFEAPTIAELARRVDAAREERRAGDTEPLVAVSRDGDLPASFAQERLWFVDRLASAREAYNVHLAIRLHGEISLGVFGRALAEMVRRHEALRTRFVEVDGRAMQVIGPEDELDWRTADLTALEAGAREATAGRLVDEESRRPFDLERGPLMRAVTVRLGERDHVLVVTQHHIISDGWSMGIFLRELAALYNAFRAGRPSPLPEPAIQYADYAAWQRRTQGGERLAAELDYWKTKLAGAPELLELPTDRPRPVTQSFRGDRVERPIGPELADGLRRLSQSHEATVFMTLSAALSGVLGRHANQDDLVIGAPIAHRNRAEVEELLGFFVNTLPLRFDLGGDPSFAEHLERVRVTALEAYAHQDVPLERVVDELGLGRDTSRSPLFQVALAYQNVPMTAPRLDGLTSTVLPAGSRTAKFDLALIVEAEGDSFRIEAEHASDLFDRTTVDRILGHLTAHLAAAVEDPGRRLSETLLPSAAERQLMTREWSFERSDYPRESSLADLFSELVETAPDKVALIFGETVVTYRELDKRSNRTARELRAAGVGVESRVGLFLERTDEQVVTVLGIIKAGGYYVPFDPGSPQARLEQMLAQARPPWLLTTTALAERLTGYEGRLLLLDADRERIAARSSRPVRTDIPVDALAYVLYTSGSTGVPKGVAVSHQSIVRLVRKTGQISFGPDDVFLQIAPMPFDASTLEIWGPLMNGGRVAIMGPGNPTLEELGDALVRYRVSFMWLTAGLFHLLVDERIEDLVGVGQLFSGGDVLSVEHVRRVLEHGKPGTLVNGYGPTENTVFTTCYPMTRPEEVGATVSIGRPINDTSVHILDRELETLPIGTQGELMTGGDGLARGYLDEPRRTAERFVPDPLAVEPGARLYHTGDLARYLADGNLEFLGRHDFQVKIRGFRIELGEIEKALQEHESVKENVVVAREDGTTKRLVAYVVPAGSEPPAAEWRRYLGERLPPYMVPAAFVVLDALPLNANGKVHRAALPEPSFDSDGYTAPREEAEKVLVEIWQRLLDVEQVGVDDNFFEVGGDSILSLQVIARAREAGLHFTTRQFFEHQTIAELVGCLGEAPAVTAEQGPVTGPLPLTPIQHWFFEQDFAEAHHWNQSVLLETRAGLSAETLERALGHLVEHHDALRLHLPEGAREAVLAEVGAARPELVTETIEGLSEEDARRRLEEVGGALAAGFDLGEAPLARAAFFDGGPERPGRLLLVVHHLAVDGVSWRVLCEDLEILCAQLESGHDARLPAKTTSLKTWSERLREHAASGAADAEIESWAPPFAAEALPVDRAAEPEANLEATVDRVSAALSVEETNDLQREASELYRASLEEVLLAALAQSTADWTGHRRLVVDLEGHGREMPFDDVDLSRTVGWLTALYPLAVDFGAAGNPAEVLAAVQRAADKVLRGGAGYGLLRYLSPSEETRRRLAAPPPAEISFNYLGRVGRGAGAGEIFRLMDETPVADHGPRCRRPYVLELGAFIRDGRLEVTLNYSNRLHRRETVEALVDGFIATLRWFLDPVVSASAAGLDAEGFSDLVDFEEDELEELLTKYGSEV